VAPECKAPAAGPEETVAVEFEDPPGSASGAPLERSDIPSMALIVYIAHCDESVFKIKAKAVATCPSSSFRDVLENALGEGQGHCFMLGVFLQHAFFSAVISHREDIEPHIINNSCFHGVNHAKKPVSKERAARADVLFNQYIKRFSPFLLLFQ